MIPKEVLNSVTDDIINGELDSLMTLYEPVAWFASQPGQLAESPDGIRECLGRFIDLKGKLALRVKRVLRTKILHL